MGKCKCFPLLQKQWYKWIRCSERETNARARVRVGIVTKGITIQFRKGKMYSCYLSKAGGRAFDWKEVEISLWPNSEKKHLSVLNFIHLLKPHALMSCGN